MAGGRRAGPFIGKNMSPEILKWLQLFRDCVVVLHHLVARLRGEPDLERRMVKTTHAGRTLLELKQIVAVRPDRRLPLDAETAFLDAKKLVVLAPPAWETVDGGKRPNREFQEYVASIDPRLLEDMVGLLAGVPVSPSVVASANAPKPPARKRHKRTELELKIIAALESLANRGEWNAPVPKIISSAGIAKSTYYEVLKSSKKVQEKMDLYHSRRLGRGPSRRGDL
jgi:hypothetical protein